jgi:hypothetical protein
VVNLKGLECEPEVEPEVLCPSPLPFFLLALQPAPHVPIVPMSVKAPVALSMLYIETLFEPEFVT